MNAHAPTTPVADSSRGSGENPSNVAARISDLNRVLKRYGVVHLRITYYAYRGERWMTVSATPRAAFARPLAVPKPVRAEIVASFLSLVTHRYPGWSEDEDVGGLFDWTVGTGDLKHRHYGYRLQYRIIEHRGL